MLPDPSIPRSSTCPSPWPCCSRSQWPPPFILTALGCRLRHAWGPVIALQALLVISAWAATETGEDQEHTVEAVIGKQYVEAHEDLAERLLYLAWTGLGLAALGLASGRPGTIGRALFSISTVALLATAVQVGETGGDMVYKHGAAGAYTTGDIAVDPDMAASDDSSSDDD